MNLLNSLNRFNSLPVLEIPIWLLVYITLLGDSKHQTSSTTSRMKHDQIEINQNDSDITRLQTAQWILERNLAWIAAAEVKVGVIVAIDTAMLGGLGAAFSTSEAIKRTLWTSIWTYSAALLIAAGLFCAAMAVLPRVTGPANSLLFFGRIGNQKEHDYVEQLSQATAKKLLEDWATQIHRNAQIACDKFSWVRKSMYWSFLSLLPWFAAISSLLEK